MNDEYSGIGTVGLVRKSTLMSLALSVSISSQMAVFANTVAPVVITPTTQTVVPHFATPGSGTYISPYLHTFRCRQYSWFVYGK